MEKIDKRRLEIAIRYLERMAEGKNPFDNRPVYNDSVIKNENTIRCMYFVKDVLEKVYKNEGYIGRIPKKKINESKQLFPLVSLEGFVYSRDKSLSEFIEQLNSVIDIERYQKLTFSPINKWLINEGYLHRELDVDRGKWNTIPTDKGKEVGIKQIMRTDSKGMKYKASLYGEKAQVFLVDNISQILSLEAID